MADLTFEPKNPQDWDRWIHRLKRSKFINKQTKKFFLKMYKFGLSRKGIPTGGQNWKYSHPRRTGETARNWVTHSRVEEDYIEFVNDVTVGGVPLINILNASKKHKGFWTKAKFRLLKKWSKEVNILMTKIEKDFVK